MRKRQSIRGRGIKGREGGGGLGEKGWWQWGRGYSYKQKASARPTRLVVKDEPKTCPGVPVGTKAIVSSVLPCNGMARTVIIGASVLIG